MGKKKEAARIAELERRELELAAELERRAKKAKKAGGKKAKAEPIPADERKAKSPKHATAKAARMVLAADASDGAREAAETALEAAAEAGEHESDDDIKARLAAKRAQRAAEKDGAAAAVGKVKTSTDALDAIVSGPKPETAAKVGAAVAALKAEVAALKAEVTEVETERGREFVVGDAPLEDARVEQLEPDVDFAKPSEAPRDDFETNGNNQYKVKRPSDGKVVGYTRATTYIGNLEDRSRLEKWKLRMLLEGVGVTDTPDGEGALSEPVAIEVRNLIHRRDVKIAKARKADRKGKLDVGELATHVEGAWSEFTKALNELAERLLDVGGANEKSQKGTDIHALCELHDREGIDAVGALLTEGKITPADLADVEAYARALEQAGIRIVTEHIEQAVVNDELKVGGRLDRVVYVKLPGAQRATRMVADIKTGNVELGVGKLAQQLEMYASSQAYDLDTDERSPLKVSPTKGLLIHVPAGVGKAHVYVVDLSLGRRGNKLSGEVRTWRNEGKRAVDFKVDLTALPASDEAA